MAQQIVLSGSLIFNQDGTEVGRITPEGSVLQVSSSLNISGSLILDGQDLESRLDTLEAGQSGDELTFGNLLSWTGSTDSRLYSIEQTTGSLNSFTGSYNTGSFSGSFTGSFNGDGTLITGVISSSYAISASSIEWDNVENKPTGIISRSAQISNLGFISGSPELEATASLHEFRLDTLETKTGSLDSEQTTQDARLSSLETKTGSLNTEQATQDSRLSSLELETGSITTEQATQDSRLSNLETKTGSLDSEQTLQDSRLASLETESGSIDGRVTTLESSDTLQDSRLSTLETKTGSLDSEQTTQDSRLQSLETESGSVSGRVTTLESSDTTQDSRLSSLETKTGSLDSEQTLQDSRLTTLETKTGSLDSEQTLQDSRLASLELETGSITSEQSTQDSRLDSLETESGSIDGRVSTLESSDTLQDARLASLETESGSIDGRVGTLEGKTLISSSTQFKTISDPFTGSFSGSFTGIGNFTDLTADAVEYSNVLNKPTLISQSAQIADEISGSFTQASSSFSTRVSTLELNDTAQDSRLSTLETKTGSLDSEQTLQDSRLGSLELETGSITTEQSTQDSRLSSLELETGSITTEQSLQDSRLTTLETKTGSLDSEQTLQDSRLATLETKTGSLDSEQSTQDLRLDALELETGSITTEQATQDSRLASLELETGSITTEQATQDSRLSTLETKTGSLDSEQTLQDSRLGSLETESGSVSGRVSTLEGKTLISSSLQFTSDSEPFTGSFSGSFAGDGSQLNNLPPYIINSKAGTIPSESFNGGTIASASVTFGSAFNTNNYSVTATVNSTGNIGDLGDTSVISKTSSGFTVALGAGVSTLATFTDATVDYLAVAYGETAVTTTFAETAATASYVEYSNVVSKPTLVSGSAQLAADISGSLSKEHLSSKVPGIISQSSQITVGGDLSGTANNAILTTQAISGKTELASGLANTDEFLVNDDGTLKKMDASVFISYIESSLNAQSITLNPAAIYDSSGTPVLRSGITQGELHTALGVDPAGTINFDDTTINSRLASIETKTGSLEGDDTLVDGRLDSLETKTGSLDSEQTLQDSRLASLETKTGSLESTDTLYDSRLDSIEAATSSYALEANISGAFFAPSSSFSTRVTSLESNTAYLTGSQTFTGLKTFDAGLKLNDNDDLTLGTGNDYLVDFDGTNLVIHQNIAAGNDVIITNTADTTQFTFDVSAGAFTATGDITAFSDEKLKKDIITIENALDKTNQLRGVEFTRISDDSRSIGVVAQEFEKVIPELVKTDDEGTKSVNYGQITGLLIEAIKELSAKVEDLENKLASK